MKIYSFSKKLPAYLALPFVDFESRLDLFQSDVRILELGTGSGKASGHLMKNFNHVIYSDIDPDKIIFFNRLFKNNLNTSCSRIDIENIPFPDNTFDVIVAVGVLSYCNKYIALSEIRRTLKVGGHVLILDAINSNNIFYKIHRYIKILRGIHTFRYKNMLDNNFLKYINYIFVKEKLNFYGSMYFIIPLLRKLSISNEVITNFCKYFDQVDYSNNYAFKILFHGRKL